MIRRAETETFSYLLPPYMNMSSALPKAVDILPLTQGIKLLKAVSLSQYGIRLQSCKHSCLFAEVLQSVSSNEDRHDSRLW